MAERYPTVTHILVEERSRRAYGRPVREPDPAFADPRLAELYDVFDDDRSDLDAYVAIAGELGARTVVDVGCGTGCLALLLAGLGTRVTGVDPATASLDVARAKPGSERVEWVDGDATALVGRGLEAELAIMTGNVAQVFVSDLDWHQTLGAVRNSLRPVAPRQSHPGR